MWGGFFHLVGYVKNLHSSKQTKNWTTTEENPWRKKNLSDTKIPPQFQEILEPQPAADWEGIVGNVFMFLPFACVLL